MTIYYYNESGQRALPDRQKYPEIFGKQTKNDCQKSKNLMSELAYKGYGFHAQGAHKAQIERGEIIFV